MLKALAIILGALAFQDRTPIPDPSAQKEAEKVVRDIFKDDFAKKAPADRVALAGKMASQAAGLKDDPVTAYVLLSGAQDLYSQAGDVSKAFDTIDLMAKTFAVDGSALKAAALASAGKTSKTPEDAQRLAAAHLRLVTDALFGDQYDVAEKSVQAALGLAKKASNPGLTARAVARGKEVSDLKSRYEKVKKAKEGLGTNPDDPAANLVVGQFQAIQKGFWEIGLPLLVKGSDGATQKAAERELLAPKDAPEQAAVADAWWDLAEKETGAARDNLRAHAIAWYEKAAPILTGLPKTKAEKRIQEALIEKLNRGTWVDSSDSKFFGRPSATLEVSLNARTTLQKMPPGTFDGLQVRIKAKGEGLFGVQYEPEKLDMELNVATGHFSSHHLERTTWVQDLDVACPIKDEYVLAVLIQDSECVFYLDGREAFRRMAVNDHIVGLQFYGWAGKVQVDQIKFRKKD